MYFSSVWLGTYLSTSRPIRLLQNNAIKSFYGIRKRDSVWSMYSIINIMPAAGLRDFHTLVFMYKHYYGCITDCFTGKFRERSKVHCHGTRTNGNIEVHRLVSSRTAFSVIYRGAKL